jgi:hypothetical protein
LEKKKREELVIQDNFSLQQIRKFLTEACATQSRRNNSFANGKKLFCFYLILLNYAEQNLKFLLNAKHK